MRKLVIILLLCSTIAAAQMISDYPQLFFYGRTFNSIIIKGDTREAYEINAVNYMLTALPKRYFIIESTGYAGDYYVLRTTAEEIHSKLKLASEVKEINTNAIVIGTPCNNAWVQKLLNITNCKNHFKRDEGLIKLITYNGFNVLILTGGSPYMVYETVRYVNGLTRPFYTREIPLKRGTYSYAYPIGYGRQTLPIGTPIGEVTPAIYYPYYRYPKGYGKILGTQYGAIIYIEGGSRAGSGMIGSNVAVGYPQ
jgi:hypothetical protein